MYGFIIHTDHLESDKDSSCQGLIRANGHGAKDVITRINFYELLKAGEGAEFRLYGDDDTLHYSGRLIGDSEGEIGFYPLEWAEADSGCTRIDYLRGNRWETLEW